MVVFPKAKINIGLNIVEKRPDGFHNIETVFYSIGLSDVLEIIPSKKTAFFNEGIKVDGDPEKNLVMKAYRALEKKYKLPPVEIYLFKKIPFGSGLGGGSSDAAETIVLLNSLFGLKMSDEQQHEIASGLGSDCSFFIKKVPCFASGKGEILETSEISLKDKHLLLVCPETKVNTATAYSGVTPQKPSESLKKLIHSPIEKWKDLIVNDFEKSIFITFPELEKIKNQLYKDGAIYASMSGSGSSVYGIFDDLPQKFSFSKAFNYSEKLSI
ncbi:MAG: 4-(cytidine 5'-diphospho)-2-C-methyl-D-erythritol kinase [Bacteroidetes bacterium GWF2_38_335]|nr:MAG: 4-(cytidine 5'-diphospho)-2-C-methyl-D-erythritol kinase [Bacteroidetes bacterium GWF2_38_335]OFY81485.1 MAG: 4-(cytidine 5'-diphospho)-2-C-methyl-D-erythritol kinase [Bacteroidetes bacterium RIFOXYA12_FULL_38_20]HBS87651.1 4-(cytidine 5'-diphospho)-2-C-methyl-D-erythritol kinase [Bacteroidales bacterium]